MVIDAHVHISTYTGKGESLDESANILVAEMGKNKIDYAIVIPDNLEKNPKIADLDFTLNLIQKRTNLFSLGSPQILQRGTSEVSKYKKLLEKSLIKGLKFYPGHDAYNAKDTRCTPYYELLEKLNYPAVFHTGDISSNPEITDPLIYNDPKYIVEIAKEHPHLKVIITHYYWPKINYCYEVTKNISNIYFEIAGCADDEVIEASGGLNNMIDILIKTINDRPDKIIFGTDWPLCDSKTESGFKKHINLVKKLNLSTELEEKIFWENANNIYKLGLV